MVGIARPVWLTQRLAKAECRAVSGIFWLNINAFEPIKPALKCSPALALPVRENGSIGQLALFRQRNAARPMADICEKTAYG